MNSQKRLVQRIERKLEVTIDDAFARMFGGAIVSQEIESLLRREAADGVRSLPGNRLLAPNQYIITLGVYDFEKLDADQDRTSTVFTTYLAGYIQEQGWQTYGDVVVRFEQSSNLHTGQFRARGAVNPDVEPRPTVTYSARPQSNDAFGAEPGVSPMTDNPGYRGGQGQGRPEEYYDDRYGHPQDNPRGGSPDPHGGEGPRGYPSDQSGHPPLPRHPHHGGSQDQRYYPDQGQQQGQQGGYPPSYEQRPPAPAGPSGGYGDQGYDQSYRQGGGGYSPPPGGGQPRYGGGYADYGHGPARQDEGGYASSEQRPVYPDQGGYEQTYQQGGPGYGAQDYGGDYTRYAEAPPAAEYPPARGGYIDPATRSNYDHGQSGDTNDYGQPAGGYGGYAQSGYPPAGVAVTLQLDDGSGRTYQLHEGSNVVGRGQDAQFRLPDTGVSRRHLEIRWDGQVAVLSDLNSTNGTTVNNAPVQEWQLADGDVIRLGHSEIIVRIH